jgi:hypothetical protein
VHPASPLSKPHANNITAALDIDSLQDEFSGITLYERRACGFVGGNSAIAAPQTANKMRTERIVIVAEGNDSGEMFTEFPTPSH